MDYQQIPDIVMCMPRWTDGQTDTHTPVRNLRGKFQSMSNNTSPGKHSEGRLSQLSVSGQQRSVSLHLGTLPNVNSTHVPTVKHISY